MISLSQAREPLAHHHARIARDESGLFVLPEPGAPTFVNGAEQPLPANIRRTIQAGDTLRMGSMLLRVQPPEVLPNFGPLSSLPGHADMGQSEPDMLAGMLDEWDLGNTPVAARPPPPTGATSPDALSTIVSDLRTVGVPPQASPPETPARASLPAAASGEHAGFSVGPDAAQAIMHALSGQVAPEPAGIAGVAPASALPDTVPKGPAPQQIDTWLPTRPNPGADASIAALAAFWWSFGCQPSVKDPGALCQLMAGLGAALRELVAGLEARLDPATDTGGGQNGLRRLVAGGKGAGDQQDLALWARQSFAQLDNQQHRAFDEMLAAVHGLIITLGAPAVENRLRPLVQSRFTRSRKAELWDLFCKMSDDIGHTAELKFQRDMLRQRSTVSPPAGRPAQS